MPSNTYSTYLKYANFQMASEAFLVDENGNPLTGAAYVNALVAGNFHASTFPNQLATDFATKYTVLSQIPNTSTGFSGTLFRDNATGELTLSIRSTEFIDDAVRDNQETNRQEISQLGFAFGQIDDMEKWYRALSEPGRPLAGNARFTVTGYSLGAHLATAFNILRREQNESNRVIATYTYNGAGVGRLLNPANSTTPLTDAISLFDRLRSNTDGQQITFVDTTANDVYQTLRSKLTGGVSPTASDFFLVDGVTSTADRDILRNALTRIRDVMTEADRVAGITDTVRSPVPVDTSLIDATKLDYQIAALSAGKLTKAIDVISQAIDLATDSRNIAPDAFPNLFDLYGQNPPSAVSNSQIHYGTAVPLYIENQPLFRGNVVLSSLLQSLLYGDVKLLVDNYSQNDFGDTHSLVLLADSLSLMAAFERLDGNISKQTLDSIFKAATSSDKADGFFSQGKAEGDTLETSLDQLRRLLLGDNAGNTLTPAQIVTALNGGTWAAPALRNPYQANLAILNINIDGLGALTQATSVKSLADLSASQIAAEASAVPGMGYRYALKWLNPFAVVGANSLYDGSTNVVPTHNANGELNLFVDSSSTPGGMTTEYIADRASLLYWYDLKNTQNKPNGAALSRPAQDRSGGSVQFQDYGKNLQLKVNGRGFLSSAPPVTVKFGSDADEIGGLLTGSNAMGDRMYGGRGNDILTFGTGAYQYMEGGQGNDTYVYRSGDRPDILRDTDGVGSIRYDGLNLSGGQKVADNLWQWSFSGDPRRFQYGLTTESDGSQTLTISGSNGGQAGTILVKNFVNGALGIQLTDPAAPPAPPTYDVTASSVPEWSGWFDGTYPTPNDPTHLNNPYLNRTRINVVGSLPQAVFGDYTKQEINLGSAQTLVVQLQQVAPPNSFFLGWPEGYNGTPAPIVGPDTIKGGSGKAIISGYLEGTVQAGDGWTLVDANHVLSIFGTRRLLNQTVDAIRLFDSTPADIFKDFGDVITTTEIGGLPVVDQDGNADLQLRYDFGTSALARTSRLTVFDSEPISLTPNADGTADVVYADIPSLPYHLAFGSISTLNQTNDLKLLGGSGGGFLLGNEGHNTIIAGAGDTGIRGGGAEDLLIGGAGKDQILGMAGNDYIDAGAGNDLIWGGAGSDFLFGGADDDKLYSGTGNDYLDGGAGNDELYGYTGEVTLVGGRGNDLLQGGSGDSTYVLNVGDGQDVIDDASGSNTLVFGDRITPLNVTSSKGTDGSLIISYGSGDSVTVRGGFFTRAGAEYRFLFLDPDELDLRSFLDTTLTSSITVSGNTDGFPVTAYSGGGNDTLIAGYGDTLAGGLGDDTYIVPEGVFATISLLAGDGRDVALGTGTKLFSFVEDDSIAYGSLVLTKPEVDDPRVITPRDLVLHYGTEGDSILIQDSASSVNQFYRLANGSVLSQYDLLYLSGLRLDWVGTDSGEFVFGTLLDDHLVGMGGDDTFYVGDGNNTLEGGVGNDILSAASGDDTYVFNAGDGNDTLYDTGGSNTLSFGPGVTLDSVNVLRNTSGGLNLYYGNGDSIYVQDYQDGATIQAAFSDGATLTTPQLFQLMASRPSAQGGVLGDQIEGGNADSTLDGGGGDDVLIAGSGNDTLIGGTGNDTLTGGDGDDTYVFNVGDGTDTVTDTSGVSRVEFGPGVSIDDLTVVGQGSQIQIQYGASDSVTLSNGANVRAFAFDDGSVVTARDLYAERLVEPVSLFAATDAGVELDGGLSSDALGGAGGNDTLYGGDLDDALYGGAGDDLLVGGTGNDALSGGVGGDTYFFARGDGQDLIDDAERGPADINTLQFGADILASDVTFTRQRNGDLTIGLSGTDDSVTVQGWFDNTDARLDRVVFGDGSEADLAAVSQLAFPPITGTDGDDALTGTADDDVLLGLGGADTLGGGAGNDRLEGGEGADTYALTFGVGRDTVVEAAGEASVLQLSGAASLTDVVGSRQGNDLFAYLRGTGDGLLLKDYYVLSGQQWTVRAADGTTQDLADRLIEASQSDSDEVAAARAGFDAKVRATYAADMTSQGYVAGQTYTFERFPTVQGNTFHRRDSLGIYGPLDFGSAYFSGNYDANQFRTVEQSSDAAYIGRTGFNTYFQFLDFGVEDVTMNWNHGTSQTTVERIRVGGGAPGGVITYDQVTSTSTNFGGVGAAMSPTSEPATDFYQLGAQIAATGALPSHVRGYVYSSLSTTTYESIHAGPSDNRIEVGYRAAAVDAGPGNDIVLGNDGSFSPDIGFYDHSWSDAGNADQSGAGIFVDGGDGEDTIYGGSAADILVGGNGDDYLEGKGGADTYLFLADQTGIDDVVDEGGSPGLYGGRVDVLDNLAAFQDWYYRRIGIPDWQYRSDLPPLPASDDFRVWEPLYGTNLIHPDTVQFGQGISLSDLQFSWGAHASTLNISWGPDKGVRVAMPRANDTIGAGIEYFQFADGSSLTMADMVDRAPPKPAGDQAPTLDNPVSGQTALEDAAFVFTVPDDTFSDPEGDTLTYSASLDGESSLPVWLSFDATTKTFSGTPLQADVGTLSVLVTATDDGGMSASDVFDLTVTNVNDAPVVAATATQVLTFNQAVDASSLFSVSDEDGDTPTQYQFWDSTAGNGHFTVNGVEQGVNLPIDVSAEDLANTQFVAGSSMGSDLVWVRANDGQVWGDWKSWYMNSWPHATNAAPVASAGDGILLTNAVVAAGSLFSVSDADGDPITQYELWDDVNGGGYWAVNGVQQSAAQTISVTAADLANTQYVGGAEGGAERVWVRANDGMEWGAWKAWNVTTALHIPNAAPVVTASNRAVLLSQAVDASTLFSVTDGDADAITKYEFWDSTAGDGHFTVNGVEQGVNTTIAVSADDLSNAQFVGSATPGSDTVWVRANDGQVWSDWKSWTMGSAPHLGNSAPVVSASDATMLEFDGAAAASLFSVSDGDNDPIVQYELWDDGAGGGYWAVDGAARGAGQAIPVSAGDLANTEYISNESGTERVWARANDGIEWGAWKSWNITSALHIPNSAPVVFAQASQTVLLNQAVAAYGLFSVNDADYDDITRYEFWDSTAGGGHFTVNGVEQGVNVSISVSDFGLGSTQFVGGASSSSDTVWVRANDGQVWSGWKSWTMQSSPHATNGTPVVAASSSGLLRNEAIAASDLFSVSDVDSDPVAQYEFWDDVNGGGYWRVNGVQQAAAQSIAVSAADLANTQYVGGANAGTEQVWARANDGIGWGAWKNWNMSTEGGMLRGGTGPDTLNGDPTTPVLEGGAGDDTLNAGPPNTLLSGGAGADSLNGGAGNDLLAGGAGNDSIDTGAGANVIAFNQGGGTDVVASAAGASDTLSLGGGIGYNDLSLSKSGDDLVLNTGGDDKLVMKDWYAGKDNVVNLQTVIDAMDAFDASSQDPLLNRKVQNFDFRGLVSAFDQALAESPGMTSWALTNALLANRLAASDDAALGGDLAYWYGHNGGLAGISLQAAQQVIGSPNFGSEAQQLHPFSGLQDGFAKLS